MYSCIYIFLSVQSTVLNEKTRSLKPGFPHSLEVSSSVHSIAIWDRAISFTSVDPTLLYGAEIIPSDPEKGRISL